MTRRTLAHDPTSPIDGEDPRAVAKRARALAGPVVRARVSSTTLAAGRARKADLTAPVSPIQAGRDARRWTLADARDQLAAGYRMAAVVMRTGYSPEAIAPDWTPTEDDPAPPGWRAPRAPRPRARKAAR